jgi:hypothetical protein
MTFEGDSFSVKKRLAKTPVSVSICPSLISSSSSYCLASDIHIEDDSSLIPMSAAGISICELLWYYSIN